jgi:hypothetical protein
MNHTISNCCLHAYTSTYYSRHCLQGTQTAARRDTQPSAARDSTPAFSLQPPARTHNHQQPLSQGLHACLQPSARDSHAFSQGLSCWSEGRNATPRSKSPLLSRCSDRDKAGRDALHLIGTRRRPAMKASHSAASSSSEAHVQSGPL